MVNSYDLSKIKWKNLPIIDKKILHKYYYSNSKDLPNALTYHTSGTSSGARKQIYYSIKDHECYLEHRTSIFRHFLGSDCKIACSDLGTGHAADSATLIFQNAGLIAHKIDYTAPLQVHLDFLNIIQPDVLFTMPMILEKLIGSEKLKINLKKLLLVGDIATEAWQQNISEILKIPRHNIIDLYGSIEVGSIAFFNHDIGLYQFQDHIFPEVINCPHSKENILLLTSFARNYFPAIRYQTDDLISGFSRIKFKGKEIWVFEKILGRAGEELKLGEKLSFYDLLSCIEKNVQNTPFNIVEKDFGIEILLAKEKVSDFQILCLQESLRKANSDIEMMIAQGLVKDFKISLVPSAEIYNSHFKRRFFKIEESISCAV